MKLSKIILVLILLLLGGANLHSAEKVRYPDLLIMRQANPVYQKPLTKKFLLERVKLAGNYLSLNIYDNGKFYYEVLPETGEDISNGKYSLVRHLGTVMYLYRLYYYTRDKKYLNTANKSLRYALNYRSSYKGMPVLEYRRKQSPSLGENGYGLITLSWYAKATGNRTNYRNVADDLAEFVKYIIDKTQRFDPPYTKEQKQKYWIWSQVCLGLMMYDRYYLKKQSSEIKNRVKKILSFLHFQKTEDHWYPQAVYYYNELYEKTSNIYYTLKAIIKKSLKQKYTENNAPSTSCIGTYYRKFGACMVSSRGEGILAIYKLALIFSDTSFVNYLNRILNDSIYYLLQYQYTHDGFLFDDEYDLDIDELGIEGGWYSWYREPLIRIDYVRHPATLILDILMLYDRGKYDLRASE